MSDAIHQLNCHLGPTDGFCRTPGVRTLYAPAYSSSPPTRISGVACSLRDRKRRATGRRLDIPYLGPQSSLSLLALLAYQHQQRHERQQGRQCGGGRLIECLHPYYSCCIPVFSPNCLTSKEWGGGGGGKSSGGKQRPAAGPVRPIGVPS